MSASTPLPPVDTAVAPLPAWKDEVAARLRAHRTRRTRTPDNQPPLPGLDAAGAASAVAARVAERYARIPSWREALAAEAAAKAAAEAAARAEALRIAAAQAAAETEAARQAALAAQEAAPPPRPVRSATADLPPRLDDPLFAEPEEETPLRQQEIIRYSVSSDSLPAPRMAPAQARAQAGSGRMPVRDASDPMEEALVEPARPLPARVIAFPRELVAPRKARPRIAEGPLHESGASQENAPAFEPSSQLRIFEAEPEMVAEASAPARARQALPEWNSIQLDSGDSRDTGAPPSFSGRRNTAGSDLPLQVASFSDRLMAGIVDVALTLAAFLLFVLVFALCTPHPPTGRLAAAGAAVTLLATWLIYQLIFFSLSSATPGMMYAKIALCTFSDDNPTRQAMRGRIAAQMLSALPLGLGFLWAVFDEDSLGWHDRITGTYQRSYRGL